MSTWTRGQGEHASAGAAAQPRRALTATATHAVWMLLLVASSLWPGRSVAGGFADCSAIAECASARSRANALTQSGQHDRALAEYEALYTKYLDPRLWYNIARLLHKQGRPAESLPYYRRFIDSGVETDANRLEKTRTLLGQAQQEAVDATNNQKLATAQEADRRNAELAAKLSEQPPKPPIYKRWWFWAAIGSAVVVGAIGIGVGVATIQPQFPNATELRPFP